MPKIRVGSAALLLTHSCPFHLKVNCLHSFPSSFSPSLPWIHLFSDSRLFLSSPVTGTAVSSSVISTLQADSLVVGHSSLSYTHSIFPASLAFQAVLLTLSHSLQRLPSLSFFVSSPPRQQFLFTIPNRPLSISKKVTSITRPCSSLDQLLNSILPLSTSPTI